MGKSYEELIIAPLNGVWSALQAIRNDESPEAWAEYRRRSDQVHSLIKQAETVEEFGFLKNLCTALEYGGKAVADYHREEKKNEQ